MRNWVLLAAAAAAAAAAVAAGPSRGAEGYDDDTAETIFISIASYRDSDCVETVRDAFAKAADPKRVFVGLCEQNSGEADEVCAPAAGFEHHDNVRRVAIPAREARGPTYARALSAGLYRGEAYFMQIDSHTRFQQGWDGLVIADLARCDSEKPLLTHYPPETEFLGKDDEGRADVPMLCKSAWNESGILSFEAVVQRGARAEAPRATPFVAGGFLFAPGAVVREVPFDPDLPHLFVGEEILWAARAWTSGWDFFTPTRSVVYHHYGREGKPKFWDMDDVGEAMRKSEAKVRDILAGRRRGYAFGLGSVRDIDAYWEHAGVDPRSKSSGSEKKWCPPA